MLPEVLSTLASTTARHEQKPGRSQRRNTRPRRDWRDIENDLPRRNTERRKRRRIPARAGAQRRKIQVQKVPRGPMLGIDETRGQGQRPKSQRAEATIESNYLSHPIEDI